MTGEIRKAQEFASAQISYRARQFRVAARETLHGAQRYSKFVRFMKGALPIAALGLAILVLVYVLQPPPVRMQMSFQRLSNVADDLSMQNPRLTGADNEGQPFVISAQRAMPETKGSDRIRLDGIVADFSLRDGKNIHVTAGAGVIDTKSRMLQMSGGIHLASETGYDATTPAALADLKAGTIKGDNGIDANGGFGRITAQRFAMDKTTRQLRFWGNIKMLVNAGQLSRKEAE